ncbi:MAG: hypothetical protein NC395_08990 [Prevotella sp.]|nr:hypothetical protein [Prevotella sp.]
MSEQGLAQAERRVREMNRVTRQYTEQGNRFMQRNFQSPSGGQTRFEQVGRGNTYGGGQSSPPQNAAQTRQAAQSPPYGQNIPAAVPPASGKPPQGKSPPGSFPAGNFQTGNSQMGNSQMGTPQPGGLAFLSDLKLDNEKLMIILILYLLIKEKADIKLILALGYLLL